MDIADIFRGTRTMTDGKKVNKMTREEIALNIACDLLIGSVLYGYDYDRIFEEIMDKEGCVSSNLIKEYILAHLEDLGKEYFVKEGEEK